MKSDKLFTPNAYVGYKLKKWSTKPMIYKTLNLLLEIILFNNIFQ